MSGRKMPQFLNGALLLLLAYFCGPTHGELGSFDNCLQFFYQNKQPQGITGDVYKPICQIYKNLPRFATLYNTNYRTPLYSAYILSKADGKRPNIDWMNEPQLKSSKEDKNMMHFKTPDQNMKDSQAIDDDYKDSGYTRGHLAPSGHQETEDGRKATFTLTNIVPQTKESNNDAWNKFENELSGFKDKCKDKMYVITGVLPYKSGQHKIKGRVVIPEYIWSAYCCRSDEAKDEKFPTYAAVGRNDQSSDDEIVKKINGFDVKKMSLQELEKILQTRLNMKISLFDGQCKI